MAFSVHTFGDPDADALLLQMVDDHDLAGMEQELSYIKELSGGHSFSLVAVKAGSWNRDLSPWEAPPVFGDEPFEGGAEKTLAYLLEELLPDIKAQGKTLYLGGYSLAGLFALWAGTRTDRFSGIAAASPSVWVPRFTDYLRENPPQTGAVYLSLGDREEKTRNPVMARVGSAVRECAAVLQENGTDCILEWNKGNHFKDADLRTARAFAWLLNRKTI